MQCITNAKARTWAEIDLEALRFNFHQIKSLLQKSTRVMAVVKADAYGHGAVPCAETLLDAGADYLAVATLEEALELRRAKITAPILILGYTAPDQAEMMVKYHITATVYSQEMAEKLSVAAAENKTKAKIHLKINTGMERIGFMPEQTEEMLSVCRLPGLEPEGIFTHLACADCADSSSVHTQYQRFSFAVESLKREGITIPLRHVLNSAGIFDFPEYQLEMVRPGIILYGYYPSDYIHTERAKLKPVLSLKSRVIHLHSVEEGTGIGYGWTYEAQKPIQVATVPVGYADGYSRLLSNRAEMMIGGQKVPVIGRICMDQCMIDVTSVHTITVGDIITVIGKEGEASITADDLAKKTETISYEVLCDISKRVPRLYIK
ncbi:MAG: alanine racemase [Ruminococcaceae bacterium]|nr:alanine racemase [Oscillospiraceae bacterium]